MAVAAALTLWAVSSTAAAQEDDKHRCATAYEDGQRARNGGRLLVAREQLRACVRSCMTAFRDECNAWLADVEKSIPHVVLAARTRDGAELTDVRVQLDGMPLVSFLDGKPVEVDPGDHVFRFEARSGAHAEVHATVRAGPAPTPVEALLLAQPSPERERAAHASSATSRPTPWYSIVLLGVAVAGAASFATFAGVGYSREQGLGDCSPGCSPERIGTVRTLYGAADVSLGVSIVALVGAVVTYLTRPEVAVLPSASASATGSPP